jgi:hypothetical protein
MAPDAEGTYRARPLRCHACAVRTAAVERHEGTGGGLFWVAEKVT